MGLIYQFYNLIPVLSAKENILLPAELDNRKIEIVNPQMNERDDLMQDFVSIITSFCARLYGKRRTKRQTEKIIESLTNDNK